MTSRDFCYWLQGFFEISTYSREAEQERGLTLTNTQLATIKGHLNLVFKHEIDPSMGDAQHQAELNKIHAVKLTDAEVNASLIRRYGPSPHEGWKISIHGWYDPKEGIPRC